MLAGVKFIPRDQIHKDESPDASSKQRKKSSSKVEQHRRKKKSPKYSSSDDDLEKIRRGSKKKKWHYLEDVSSGNESGSSSPEEDEKHQSRKRSKSSNDHRSRDETIDRSKMRPKSGKEKHVSDDHFLSSSSYGDSDTYSGKKEGRRKGSRKDGRKKNKESSRGNISGSDLADGKGGDLEIARKEIGLEWMLRPEARVPKPPAMAIENELKENLTEKVPKINSNELNPYLKDNGTGYPEDKDEPNAGGDKLLSSSIVGDGGASWRLKALKRAKEQAAREGRKLDEVVEERWGSLGQLAVSVASRTSAPSRAHLRAINSRKRGLAEENPTGSENQSERNVEKRTSRDYLKDVSLRLPKMREPKVSDSLSWGRRRSQNVPAKDEGLISDAFSSLNKFSDDGSFMHEVLRKQTNDSSGPAGENSESEMITSEANRHRETSTGANDGLSANQLAAKAFQLRMKGKHEEAEKLLQEVENIKAKQGSSGDSKRPHKEGSSSRFATRDTFVRQKKKEDDADLHLAQKIMQNKRYSISGRADDEYDFDDGPSRKSRKKQGDSDDKPTQKNIVANRFSTQKEHCVFCFENPRRPAHLVVAIANFSYLMLPRHEPLVPGHCCILPMEHVPATRAVDEDVWEEIRNFKKCLIMMFAEQEKDVVFLETVMGLAQQRRHCLVECIPLPRDIAKEAPLYFKKAIDEAEDEWSQHNAKRLIDTSVKGLRGSVPENFPYFHVEFGLYKGFVHVIDDEKQFQSNLGLNVIRGMLQLPEEDMYRRQRYESVEVQKQAVKSFACDWARFDWTKQLDQAS